ncbi:unnamed protein product [Sympodiomycopsis kandeliae]
MADQSHGEQQASGSGSSGSSSLTRREFQRVPSANSLVPPTSEQGLTADDLLAHQALLESQAREAIPFSYSLASCTYSKGYIRQPLYACTTCGGGAVCAGCSIGCHAEHDLIELFAKRHSRCDCGTPSLQRKAEAQGRLLKPCTLREAPLNFAVENDENTYGKNHDGHFCYCDKGYTYDPHEEEETMFQCMVCEEWLHETCTSLRPRKKATPASSADQSSGATGEEEKDDPPPLISHEAFDSMICDACVRRHAILQHYIGVKQWGSCLQVEDGDGDDHGDQERKEVLVSDHIDGPTKYVILGLPINEEYGQAVEKTSVKRGLSPIAEFDGGEPDAPEHESKRVKLGGDSIESQEETKQAGIEQLESEKSQQHEAASTSTTAEVSTLQTSIDAKDAGNTSSSQLQPQPKCRLPPTHPLVKHLLQKSRPEPASHANNPNNFQNPSYRLDVFLDEEGEEDGQDPSSSTAKGFRRRLCRCEDCSKILSKDLPFLLEEEYTYSPPASVQGDNNNEGDNDETTSTSSHSSSYDMGLNALNNLPRAQTLEALEGYNRLRSALFEHFKPFAESGQQVDEESIRLFFQEQRRRDREQQQR